ncbi:GDSL-type esterase/lipase family protein [Acetobacterium tundrae]|uniref:SGNH hydrolase-type esterase domain-containing protein n=1 Tax=Acetobacterium tundrae TaxID=132932 RepID=A0ABR6WLT2_9FIRM|nr:GDSL-type esterase/lipase family protein [Acetobacterium tundrae]MBC3797125.1 hypothetical protein [Acetobacterium tundrae]
MKTNKLIPKIKTSPRIVVIIIILILIIGVVVIMNFQNIAKQNSEIKAGVDELTSLESRDLFTMEEKIDFMKHEAVDAGNYPDLFDSSVVYGDSIAEGLGLYGYLSASSLVAILGKSIDNSQEDVPKIVDLSPRTLFIELGLNDISHPDSTLDSYIASYEQLIDVIQEQLPNTQIYICSIFPVTDKVLQEQPVFSQIETYNTALIEMANRKNIHYIDTYTLLKTNPQYHEEDGIHVVKAFYPLWLDNLVKNSDLSKLL